MYHLNLALASIVAFATAVPANGATASHTALVDQRGAPFSLAQLRGSNVVVTFVAARCTGVCPLVNAQIAEASRDPGLYVRNVRFVTITLDPMRDTHADVARLARAFRADPARWILASGPAANVRAVLEQFGVLGNAREHTTFVYVLGADGRLRARFPASANVTAQIAGALQ